MFLYFIVYKTFNRFWFVCGSTEKWACLKNENKTDAVNYLHRSVFVKGSRTELGHNSETNFNMLGVIEVCIPKANIVILSTCLHKLECPQVN